MPAESYLILFVFFIIFCCIVYQQHKKDKKNYQEYLNLIESGMTQKQYNNYKWKKINKGKR